MVDIHLSRFTNHDKLGKQHFSEKKTILTKSAMSALGRVADWVPLKINFVRSSATQDCHYSACRAFLLFLQKHSFLISRPKYRAM